MRIANRMHATILISLLNLRCIPKRHIAARFHRWLRSPFFEKNVSYHTAEYVRNKNRTIASVCCQIARHKKDRFVHRTIIIVEKTHTSCTVCLAYFHSSAAHPLFSPGIQFGEHVHTIIINVIFAPNSIAHQECNIMAGNICSMTLPANIPCSPANKTF